MNLSSAVKITKIKDPTTTSATGNIESDILDMQGYEGVAFVTSFGTPSSSNSIKAKMATANASAGMVDIAGSLVGVASSDEDVWLEIHRPRQRYLQVEAVRQAASKLGDIWAIQYGAKKKPVDNTIAGTIHGELHASPDSGTA